MCPNLKTGQFHVNTSVDDGEDSTMLSGKGLFLGTLAGWEKTRNVEYP